MSNLSNGWKDYNEREDFADYDGNDGEIDMPSLEQLEERLNEVLTMHNVLLGYDACNENVEIAIERNQAEMDMLIATIKELKQ